MNENGEQTPTAKVPDLRSQIAAAKNHGATEVVVCLKTWLVTGMKAVYTHNLTRGTENDNSK